MSNPDNHFIENVKALIVPIHKAGWPFVAAFAGGMYWGST